MYDQSKLSELTRFARVEAGSIVIDVYPGDGDWTRLFSAVVGPEGRVFSFVPAEIADLKPDQVGRMRTLAKESGRENVEAVSANLVAMPKATQQADVVWMHLFYHDLHTALMQKKGATAADFNRGVYERLKTGGFYVIVDHAAAAGAGTSNAHAATEIEARHCRDAEAVIIGGANSAGQAAMFLSRSARHVRLLVRGSSLAASMSSYLRSRLEANPKITIEYDTEVTELHGADSLEAVTVRGLETGETRLLHIPALFIMVGAVPNTEWLSGLVELDGKGFVITGRGAELIPSPFGTSQPGVFAVGDVRAGSVKRVASSVGEGSVVIAKVWEFVNG